jgi:hypothetical protein
VLKADAADGVNRETVLWDLAGQPAYRAVHQLSMDDAAVACVLFDSRGETNPFEGAEYWSKVLDQTRANTKVRKILVAARTDVGGLPAGRERIESFAREHGFDRFLATSAKTGEGCEELLETIEREIPWSELPTLTTTSVLASMREYVAKLKEERRAALFPIADLYEGFVAYYDKGITIDEFIRHLDRLEATDAVTVLVFRTTGAEPRAEDLVLLDPTRIDAYSSAILVTAKDEPDGPGHLLESHVKEGRFQLDPEERIGWDHSLAVVAQSDREAERHVLWYVMEKLVSRDLALRERIGEEDYLVFPSQCTAEMRFPGAAAFGVAFGFAGPVRSIYARLVAHLAHYEGFSKREFFQDAAAYYSSRQKPGGLERPPQGAGLPHQRCLIQLEDLGGGNGELMVFFDKETAADVRQGFLEFVGKQLESKSVPGSVTRRYAYHCAKCGNPFEDRVVKARIEQGKKAYTCPMCDAKTNLVNLLAAPTKAAVTMAKRIVTDAEAGRQSMAFELVIEAKKSEGKFDVFLSYHSKDKAVVRKIADRLIKQGILPWLDERELAPGDTVVDVLEREVRSIPCGAFFIGKDGIGKWQVMEMRAYVERWASKDARMIPVILPRVEGTPDVPTFLRQVVWADLRDRKNGFSQLVRGILKNATGDLTSARLQQ